MKRGSMRFLLMCFVGVVAFGFLSVQPAKGQVLSGGIVGTVTDPSGAAVPGAQVTITSVGTGVSRSATTNTTGNYSFTDVPEGDYTLDVSAKGFKPLKKTDTRVIIGSINQQNVQLQLGAVTQQVTVKGSAAVLQTQTTNVHTTIGATAIANMPLDVYGNFQTLELLTPGTFSLSGSLGGGYPNALGDTPERSLAINTDGLPQHINTTRVDGSTDMFIWLPDHLVIVPPAASIQEVNVQTANFGVQTGLTAGAATNVITKSGTNQLHGELYGYLNNDRTDAQNTFIHVPRKPKLIQDNEGFTLGGPIKKNKLWFFGNWDGFFDRESNPSNFTVPYQDMRAGNFSSYLGAPLFDSSGNPVSVCTTDGGTTQLRQGMVFDPTTGNPATGTGRCAFTNNVIPASRMYQGAINYWGLMNNYQPNQTGPFILNQNTGVYAPFNDTRGASQVWNRNIYTEKTDWQISQRQTLWVKYTLMNVLLDDASTYGAAGQGAGQGTTHSKDQMVTLGHTWTISPNLVLSGHVGFTRLAENVVGTQNEGQNLGQTTLGLVNSNTPLGNKMYSGMPGIIMAGWSGLGDYYSWEPLQRDDWTLTLDEDATWMHGNHQVSFGLDMAHNHMNHPFEPAIYCCVRGQVSMSEGTTFDNINGTGLPATLYTASGTPAIFASAPWNSVAAFDLGLASNTYNDLQWSSTTSKDWQEGLYIGDLWRATRKLTVNAGLRWEYYPLITRDGLIKFETYDPANDTLKLGGVAGNPTHLGVTTQKDLLAPRIGLAYMLNDKTVVRSAFGISYDTLPLERPLRGFWPYEIGAQNFVTIPGVSGNITQYLPVANFNAATNAANNIVGSPATASGLADGIPLLTGPVGLSSGVISPPLKATVGTMAQGEHFKRAYVESWNLTLQRKLPSQVILNVGYVGNHLVHELNGVQMNAAPFNTGALGQPLYAAFGRTSDAYLFQGYLDSHYNSLQVSFERPMAQGLMFQGSYTWSKAISYIDDEGWEDGLMFNCPPSASMPQGCQSHNRGDPFFDRTHMFNVGFVYTLPFGKGNKWGNSNPAARAIVGGWQINGVLTAMSGQPLTITGPNFLNTPWTSQTANFVGPLNMLGGTGPGQFWFNPNAFSPSLTPNFGTSGRGLSWLRGPGLGQLDFSVFRHFKFTERFDLELRMDAQNLTNTPHFSNPATGCSLVSGGCGGTFGQIFSAYGQRIIKLGVKLDF